MPKMTMSCCDLSDWVPFVLKTKQDNNVTYHTSAVYAKNDVKLSWPIKLDATRMKTKQDNDVTDLISLVYTENKIELSWLIRVIVAWGKNQTKQQCDQTYKCGIRLK